MLFACPLFPWLAFIVCLCAHLLFSVWLPSALCSSFSWYLYLHRLVGPLATVSSFGFLSLLSLAASSVSLFLLVFHFAVLGSPPVAWWPSVFFWPCSLLFLARKFLSTVLGFSSSCLGLPVGLPRGFLSCPVAFLSSSRLLLRCRGSLCALCFPPFYHFGGFVLFCLRCSFFLLSWFSGSLDHPSLSLSLVSFFFFSCLVFLFGSFFLFCTLTSGPPGVSPVTASSSTGHPASLSSAVAAASSTSFGFSPLAYVFWGCSPLGGVSLGSGCASASRLLFILPV